MSLTLSSGGTRTGTDSHVFEDTGMPTVNGRTFSATTSTLLKPRVLKISAQIPTTTRTNPGRATSTVRMILGERVEDSACCTVKAGSVIVDIKVSYPLDQPDTLLDEAVEFIQGLSYSTEFTSLIKTGRIPV